MNFSIDLAPLISWYLIAPIAFVAALLLFMLFYRRSRGSVVRLAAVLALIAALLNPTLRQEERETLANIAFVVVDESASQMIAQRPAQAAAIKTELQTRLGKIKNLETKWITAARPVDGAPPGTNLFAALNAALADTPPDRIAGAILVTDGQVHDVPKQAASIGFNAPVHALLTGSPGEFDRRIEVSKAPKFGIVGQSRDIEITVRETGTPKRAIGAPVQIKVRREDKQDEIITTEVGRPVTIEMAFPHAGMNIVEVDLDPTPGELTLANNRAVIAAEGVRENVRVLLVSGEPHAGERTWRNLLKSDAAIDLVHFTILRPPEKQDGTPVNQLSLIAFPTRELFSEKINDFDLIIFDRYEHRGILQLLYYDNIARYVDEHGGALLIAAGDDYASSSSIWRTPLSPVLPAPPTGRVIEQPFKAKLTADGDKHPVTKGLDGGNKDDPGWGRWFRQAEVRVDRGQTLLDGADKRPLLVLDRKGKGRVALLTSDHAWLWARGYEGGGPYTDLLRRLSHWLMKEPDLEEERLIASAKGMKLTIERYSMKDKVEPVRLSAPGGETSELTLEPAGAGRWRTAIDVKLPGLYKAESEGPYGTLTAVAHAGSDDPREMKEPTATDTRLRDLLAATGGATFWTRAQPAATAAEAAEVDIPRISLLSNARVMAGSGWLGLRDREAQLTRGVSLKPMFTGLIALSALLMLLALAWWREGK